MPKVIQAVLIALALAALALNLFIGYTLIAGP
jgi:hypothetical protein